MKKYIFVLFMLLVVKVQAVDATWFVDDQVNIGPIAGNVKTNWSIGTVFVLTNTSLTPYYFDQVQHSSVSINTYNVIHLRYISPNVYITNALNGISAPSFTSIRPIIIYPNDMFMLIPVAIGGSIKYQNYWLRKYRASIDF